MTAPSTERETLEYLLASGLLSEADVFDSCVRIRPCFGRNRNWRVETVDDGGFFLKQASRSSLLSRETIHAEAEFYQAGATLSAAVQASLPEFVAFDAEATLLVLRLLTRHRTLRELHLAGEPYQFPISAYRHAGAALAAIHASGEDPAASFTERRTEPHPNRTPLLARPHPRMLHTLSQGGLETLGAIQSSHAIEQGLERLTQTWRPQTVVHGDIRADNVMVAEHDDGTPDVRFVDWELWHVGDPAADLAGLLGAIVTAVLGRLHLDEPDDGSAAHAEAAVPVIQAACRATWQSYCAARGPEPSASGEFASRTALCCAGRLVQAAVEHAAEASAVPDDGLTLLQIAANLFTDPERGADEFLVLR